MHTTELVLHYMNALRKTALHRVVSYRRHILSFRIILGRNCRFTGHGRITLREGAVLRDGCRIESNGILEIGKGCFLNNNVSITSMQRIVIGDYVSIGNNVVIVDHDHNYRQNGSDMFMCDDVEIGSGVWIGANTVILKGSRIGNDCVIAACSVVKGKVPANSRFITRRESSIETIQR